MMGGETTLHDDGRKIIMALYEKYLNTIRDLYKKAQADGREDEAKALNWAYMTIMEYKSGLSMLEGRDPSSPFYEGDDPDWL